MIEFLKKLTHLDSRWHWIALGLVAIVLRYLLGFFPQFIETYYSRGLFSGIRQVIDNTLAFSPVPLIYLFFAIAIFILLRGLIKPWRRQGTVVSKTLQSLFSLAAFTAGLIFFFLLLWGFN